MRDIGKKIIISSTVSWIYKTQEKFPNAGEWIFMNLDCICSLLGSSFEFFCPLELSIWRTAQLINEKSIGSDLDLHFLLGNAIIKFIFFPRPPVLIS